MPTNYCTIFDKNYLFQGLALYLSLKKVSRDFKLYVLCLDEISLQVISTLNTDGDLIPVKESALLAQYPELSEHRLRTSYGQYCWSCQPFFCEFALAKLNLPSITYLEADSMFFSDAAPLFREIGEASASLVPHRFTPEFDQTEISGPYCAQFNFFRNNAEGFAVLKYWKECCLEYRKELPLSYPGQLKFREWPRKFGKSVAVVEHLGAGVAPWNIQQYELKNMGSAVLVNNAPAVFYHFHEFAFLKGGGFDLGGYPLPRESIAAFYRPYANTLAEAEALVKKSYPDFNYRKERTPARGLRPWLRRMRQRIRGRYNIYAPGELENFFAR